MYKNSAPNNQWGLVGWWELILFVVWNLKSDSSSLLLIWEPSLSVLFQGEEISGSEGSGSDDMDEGEDETADGGERRRKRRGWSLRLLHTVFHWSEIELVMWIFVVDSNSDAMQLLLIYR